MNERVDLGSGGMYRLGQGIESRGDVLQAVFYRLENFIISRRIFYGAERSMTCSKKKKKPKLTSVPNLCEVNPWTPKNTFIAE